jgi:pantoate--beta-alanine ligase
VRAIAGKDELRAALDEPRRAGAEIGLVPTMGALHDGHRSLLAAARERCDLVVMSLFVNPTQFGPGEDLDSYPRDHERDERIAGDSGVDLLYAPAPGDVYAPGHSTSIDVGELAEVLCGDPARRGPEHFRGVAIVVAKLLNIVQPSVAFFGQKDAQQALVIKRMVRDLDFPVRIEVLPTVREPDGLAMSSRNSYLEPADRERAAALSHALQAARRRAGEGADPEGALASAREVLAAAGIEPEYLEARDAEDLSPTTRFNGHPVLVAVAARVGKARLIDNVVIVDSEGARQGTPTSD